jgi:predicted nucleic acid-binding protein
MVGMKIGSGQNLVSRPVLGQPSPALTSQPKSFPLYSPPWVSQGAVLERTGAFAPGRAGRPTAVLDTNVMIDWLVFREQSIVPLVRDIESGRFACLGTAAMRAEFAAVLGRSPLAERCGDLGLALARWDGAVARYAGQVPAHPVLRCRDGDDQPFVDLALAAGARWLISRDKDLLALARSARRLGLTILRPQDWGLATPAAPC